MAWVVGRLLISRGAHFERKVCAELNRFLDTIALFLRRPSVETLNFPPQFP